MNLLVPVPWDSFYKFLAWHFYAEWSLEDCVYFPYIIQSGTASFSVPFAKPGLHRVFGRGT